MIVVTADGEYVLLNAIAIAAIAAPFKARLYVNDHSPEATDTLASFTEASFPGYSPAILIPDGVQLDIITQSFRLNFLSASFSPNTFLKDRPRMYGYFVTDFLNTFCIFAERFPNRIYLEGPTDIINFRTFLGSLSEFTG